MNKEQFLNQLTDGLTPLQQQEWQQIVDYYCEMILDGVESGKSEEEVVSGLGSPQTIAAQICEEYGASERKEPLFASQSQEYLSKAAVHTAVIDTRSTPVRVRPSQDGRVRVLFAPRQWDQVTVREEDGVFQFLHQWQYSWRNLFFWNRREIVLELPLDFSGEINVKTTDATIELSGFSGVEKAQLFSRNAVVCVKDCSSDVLVIQTTNGGVKLDHVTGGHCGIETNNGSVTLTEVTVKQCGVKTSNASVTAKQSFFSKSLWAKTSNGAVHILSAQSPDFNLKTSNGAINGVIIGNPEEYAVISRTSNAKNNLQNGGEGKNKRLSAVTSNGAIHLEFAPKQNPLLPFDAE